MIVESTNLEERGEPTTLPLSISPSFQKKQKDANKGMHFYFLLLKLQNKKKQMHSFFLKL